MSQSDDAQLAALVANLILDQAISISAGCQQLQRLLRDLGADRDESYVIITRLDCERDYRMPMIPDHPKYGNTEVRVKKGEEIDAYCQLKEEIFAACRAIVRRYGKS
jgi:hypothetical protein